MDKTLVSIWCITYNHEQYIRDALESFLAQKTNFGYEIIVHDDASTDRTAEIVKEYEKKYPDLIHGIYQTENQTSKNGTDRRWIWSIQSAHCKGKYIAFCEGDDYWLDNYKLQMQIDFMEQNPEYVLTAHDAVIVNIEKGDIKAMHPYDRDCDITATDIIMRNHAMLPAASIIFRRGELTDDFYKYFLDAGVGDYPLRLWMVTRGKIYYFSRIMSVYRYMHPKSWNKRIRENYKSYIIHIIKMLRLLKIFDKYTEGKYQDSVVKGVERLEKWIFRVCCQYISLELFEPVCDQCDIETEGLYHEEFESVKKMFLQMFHAKSFDLFDDICQFHQKYRHIYIMGAGHFGAAIAEQMKYSGLDFEGFVISSAAENRKTYLKKPVLELKDIPYDFSEVGIIIGINLEKWTDVIVNLEIVGLKNYLVSLVLKGFIALEDS